MSQRHRTTEVPLPPKQELRAHAHSERHRIHVELQSVAQDVCAGVDPEDVHEPGAAWKPMHHHDAEVRAIVIIDRADFERSLTIEGLERYGVSYCHTVSIAVWL